MELQKQDTSDRRFAQRISMMIESRLIWYKHYHGWADKIVLNADSPPSWVLEIATVKTPPRAVQVINEFIRSEPFEPFDADQYTDEYIACLFLRYKRREIAWATFLNDTGALTDAANGHRYCEYFYQRLNTLEDNEYSKATEYDQRAEVEREFQGAIAEVEQLYTGFLKYFRLHVEQEARQKTN